MYIVFEMLQSITGTDVMSSIITRTYIQERKCSERYRQICEMSSPEFSVRRISESHPSQIC